VGFDESAGPPTPPGHPPHKGREGHVLVRRSSFEHPNVVSFETQYLTCNDDIVTASWIRELSGRDPNALRGTRREVVEPQPPFGFEHHENRLCSGRFGHAPGRRLASFRRRTTRQISGRTDAAIYADIVAAATSSVARIGSAIQHHGSLLRSRRHSRHRRRVGSASLTAYDKAAFRSNGLQKVSY